MVQIFKTYQFYRYLRHKILLVLIKVTFHVESNWHPLSMQLTIEIPSLRRDSPRTAMWRISLTWTCSKTASTATGSTAEISDANTRECSNDKGVLSWNAPAHNTPHNETPIQIELSNVPMTAYKSIVPILSKKARFGMKYPASKMIGGKRTRKKSVVSRW